MSASNPGSLLKAFSFSLIPNERHDPTKPDDKQDELHEDEMGSPIAIMAYDFLTQPESSKYAFWWNAFTSFLVVIRIIEIGVESVNGPNQYHNRKVNRSRYNFLFTDEEYFHVYIMCFVPLIIDGFARVVLMVLMMCERENKGLYIKFKKNMTERILFVSDTFGLLPFFIYAGYVRPNDVSLSQAARITLRLMELFTTGRIFRAVRRFPAIRAISVALGNAFEHLVLPIFFFFVFNITAGVFFYFVEPCYDASLCPWINLFESTFYAIVTMTTTGYGNQVPSYEFGRFVACCVMLFGALYLSLPLAIIGNEYDKAWSAIQEELRSNENKSSDQILKISPEEMKENQDLEKKLSSGPSLMSIPENSQFPNVSNVVVTRKMSEMERRQTISHMEKKKTISKYSPIILSQQIQTKLATLMNEIQSSGYLGRSSITSLCEVKAWLPTLLLSVEEVLRSIFLICHRGQGGPDKAPRRFSIVGGGSGLRMASSGSEGKQVTFNNPFSSTATTGISSGISPSYQLPFSATSNNSVTSDPKYQEMLAKLKLSPDEDDDHSLSNFSLSDEDDEDGHHHHHHHFGNATLPPPTTKMTVHEESSDDEDSVKTREDECVTQVIPVAIPTNKVHEMRPSQILASTSHHDDHHDSDSGSEKGEHHHHDEQRKTKIDQKLNELSKLQAAEMPKTRKKRTSLYVKLLHVIGVSDKESRRRSVSEQFLNRMKKISENPDSIRSRIWILLEIPQSSKEARALQLLIVALVCLSIFILYTQTITSLSLYGESTHICGKTVQAYCYNKNDPSVDPGCFVQTPDVGPSTDKLSYDCDHAGCFGQGVNFGALYTNMTCVNGTILPFQTKSELEYTYGRPYLFTSREEMHRINPICTRLECIDNSANYYDGNTLWIAVELLTNIIFSIELILRIVVAESLYAYWQDKMNLFDIFAIIPFYTEMFGSLRSGAEIDFSILSSSPEPIFFVTMRSLKVFRLLKLTRHFRASKVLTETAHRVWKQILGMLGLLCFLVTLFSIIFFEMERGRKCYVGDAGCDVPESVADVVHVGDVIYINKNGDPSQFPNVFFGVWFSFVTLTTVGYGDIVPVTNGGQVMAIFLMLSGTFYMAMPLTAAASTFYTVHEQEKEKALEAAAANANASLEGTAMVKTSSVAPEPEDHIVRKLSEEVGSDGNEKESRFTFTMSDQRLQISVRYSLSEIKQFEQVIQRIVEELYENQDIWQVHGIGNDSRSLELKDKVTRTCKSLEETLVNSEQELIDLLLRYHSLLHAKHS